MCALRGGPRTGARVRASLGATGLLLAGCGGGGDQGAGADAVTTADAVATVDVRETTYDLTCDGVVPEGFTAQVRDGAVTVPADGSRPPFYDSYEVRVAGSAVGDLDGAGGPDAVVLLECSPQPSNGVLQEVLLVSATGRLGALPSPRTLQGSAPLPPVYDPAGLSVQDGGVIVARMSAYAPEDTHADGPSVPVTYRWRLDQQGVVHAAS